MEENLQNLSTCLQKASELVADLASEQGTGAERVRSPVSVSNTRLGMVPIMATRSVAQVGNAVNRARAMMQQSSSRGLYSRLNQRERLRATTPNTSSAKKMKVSVVDEPKVFEFVLVNFDDEDGIEEGENLLLCDEAITLRGFVHLNTKAKEAEIRKEISKAIQIRFPLVREKDFEFLKANRRKLTKPVNLQEYNYKQVKLLAGQGAIYVKLKNGYKFVLSQDEPSEMLENTKEPKETVHSCTRSYSQPSQLEVQDTELLESVFAESKDASISEGDDFSTIIAICKSNNIENPTEILRCAQKSIVTGRPLEASDLTDSLEGDTNYILVNRHNLLATAMEEIKSIKDPRITLEVDFYGEKAHDSGGPRKEFFRLCLREIKEKYFDNGIQENLAEDYEVVGLIMSLSILQNGCVPRFMPEKLLQELFMSEKPSQCISYLRMGFRKLGLYQIGKELPVFLHLLRPSPACTLTRKKLTHLLNPIFAEEGTNARIFEDGVYSAFSKYVREAASGRRGTVTLEHILQFVTCTDEEPLLGYVFHPAIHFVQADNSAKWSFIPTANTCINSMNLPTASYEVSLPAEFDLFEVYDIAFSNAYFGNV